eukprot:787290-Pelagomonas_calceolata.AAC.5
MVGNVGGGVQRSNGLEAKYFRDGVCICVHTRTLVLGYMWHSGRCYMPSQNAFPGVLAAEAPDKSYHRHELQQLWQEKCGASVCSSEPAQRHHSDQHQHPPETLLYSGGVYFYSMAFKALRIAIINSANSGFSYENKVSTATMQR